MAELNGGPLEMDTITAGFAGESWRGSELLPVVLRCQDEQLGSSPLLDPDLEDGLWSADGAGWLEPGMLLDRVVQDHLHYYSLESMAMMGVGFGAAALMAHTPLDEDLHAEIHWQVWHGDKRDWAEGLHAFKDLGNGRYTLPVFAGAWLAGKLLDDVPGFDIAGEWGERSLRSFLVGAPPLLAMQWVVGASRPGESSHGSYWSPFSDTNGVSGHTFMGALPFLSAAKMSDTILLKATFYAASMATGLSRIADDDHYLSQVFLGWVMAYAAATAVDRTQQTDTRLSLFPLVAGDTVGAAVEYRW